jgi:hypothetical protein
MGVTSVLPQETRILEKPALKRLIGGTAIPCVRAAPRAMVVQRLSTSFGVARIMSTGGSVRT